MTDWRRDPVPSVECSCSHAQTLHDISTKRMACSVCRCQKMSPARLRWTEHRTVLEDM